MHRTPRHIHLKDEEKSHQLGLKVTIEVQARAILQFDIAPMSKKSRKLKKAAERKSALGLKKTGGKVKKEALVKALSEHSVSVIAPPVKVTAGKKKNKHRGKKAAIPKPGVEQKEVVTGTSVNRNAEQTQGENVSTVEKSGKGKKKRKRNRKKGNSLEPSSADQKLEGSTTAVSNSNGSVKECGKSRKRRKRKATQEVAMFGPVVESVNPPKKVRMEEASSDSEPELIHADWGLTNDSSDEKGSKAEAGSESDLDISEEDVDEEPPRLDESADDGDVDVEIEDEIKVMNKDDIKESESGNPTKNSSLEIKKSGEGKSKVNAQDGKTQSGRANTKKFSLSDKATILKEIQERTAEFDSRCLYVAPIPGDCTFDTLKKFIPKMKSCRFFTRPKSNKLRTFVFVEFADAETAGKEKLSISGRLFAGRSMRAETRSSQQHGDKRVTDEVHGPEDIDFSRILVTGLVPGVNQTDLKSIFPTAENIRLPTSPHNFNYGYAILGYVSDAVALDAFSQCHRLLLKGHPISVNFALKPPEKKLPASVANASPSKPNMLIRPQEETQPVQHVGKVIIQPMANAGNAEGVDGLTKGFKTSDLVKPTRIQQSHTQNSGGKEAISKDEGTKEKLVVEEARDDAASTQSASLLSEMIKQAKKEKAEEVIAVESDGGKNSDDDKGFEVEGNSEEGESNDDGSNGDDGTDEGESDGEDEIEVVGGVSSSASDDDDSKAEEVDMPAGDDSEGETIDASLAEVLKARRTCAKALKSPGAKRNWKATVGKKRSGTMPKVASRLSGTSAMPTMGV
ncbi:Poly U binding-splicing factor half pint [Taenia solium]|eukprot:TsM_000963000 transcript=TsM_000963000 gene=TsM_000963000